MQTSFVFTTDSIKRWEEGSRFKVEANAEALKAGIPLFGQQGVPTIVAKILKMTKRRVKFIPLQIG